MKAKLDRPWILPNRKPLCDSLLKRAVRSWTPQMWENYLHWYEKPCKEALISALGYDLICEGRTQSIFEELGYDSDPVLQAYCEALLDSIPAIEAKVLRHYYLDGLTELQTAIRVKTSQPGAHGIKKRGLSRLRRENSDAALIAIHIMRGLSSQEEPTVPTFEMPFPADPIRENRSYHPASWKSELQAVRNEPVRKALSELSSDQQRIVYLRFWCDQSISEIARQLGIGINVAQMICDAAAFKLKGRAVELAPKPLKEVSL